MISVNPPLILTARDLILSQLAAFEVFDEYEGWCDCNEAFLEAGSRDPHCHVHRHVKTFRECVVGATDITEDQAKGWLLFLEGTWCICFPEYKEKGLRDPNCQIHTHARKFRDMVDRALVGPHCKDCPGPYCPIDERPYVADAPDPVTICSWAKTGRWANKPLPEPS